jgi:prophage DNA circulation protein
MSWVDQLQPASFRGVPFHVHSIDVQAGDNVVVREYPFQDLPTVFRMGEAAEEIKFSAYVIGDDYIAQREALREVLSGEGVLVHPTAGSLRVFVAGRFSISEAPTDEGGMARFELTFIRAEPRRYPVGVQNTEGEAVDAALAATEAAEDAFAIDFNLGDVSGWVADVAGNRLWESINYAWGVIGPVVGSVGEFSSGLIGRYQLLVNNFSALLSQPLELARSIGALFDLPADLEPARAAEFQTAFERLFRLDSAVPQNDRDVSIMPPVGGGFVMFGTGDAQALAVDSPAQADRARLMVASDQFIGTLAVASYVRAATVMEITSYDDGMAMRRAVHEQCTTLLVRASEQPAPPGLPGVAWHDAVSTLHMAALKDLQARTRNLVRMTTYTPQAWQPVWWISYRLYGTATYADEILGLNPHIRHPLLVPPGVPLRVMRHD